MWFNCMFVFLFILAFNGVAKSSKLPDVLEVNKVSTEIVINLQKAWKTLDPQHDYVNAPPPFIRETERKIFDRIKASDRKVDKLDSDVYAIGERTMFEFIQILFKRKTLELRVNSMIDYFTQVRVAYKTMQSNLNDANFEKLKLKDFALEVISNEGHSVKTLLDQIHALLSSSNQGLVEVIANALNEVNGDMICEIGQSPQQVLYTLYNTFALAELKGYIAIQFSYMLLRLYNVGDFTKEVQLSQEEYERRTTATIKSIKDAMKTASRQLWKCDPKEHVKNITYLEITEFLQGYIENEIDLDPDGKCFSSCSEFSYTRSHNCYKNRFCSQQRRCNGRLTNCQFIASSFTVCPSEAKSGKRYEYVEFENRRILGQKRDCQNRTISGDSWHYYLVFECSYCFCLCDDQGPNSDRYINMRPAMSNTSTNMVVTGLRFAKINGIIHLQIQEGKLLPNGNIDQKSVRWVPPENYKTTDRHIYKNQDFYTLTWDQHAIDLDDLVADEGHILTGVRFKRLGSHLNFEIYQTPFDFETGLLLETAERSFWKSNDNTEHSMKTPRAKLHLNNPNVPIRTLRPSVLDSRSNQYLEFTHTGMDNDAAQTTVPFFDAQPVETFPAVPLSGAGIYHKGQKTFGGFLGVKVFTYDFSEHLHEVIQDDV